MFQYSLFFFVECFGVILKGVKFGFDYSSIKRVLACFLSFLESYQLKGKCWNRLLSTCCVFLRVFVVLV